MARPSEIRLTSKEQKAVLARFKKETQNARTIASDLKLPRYQVMYFLERSGLRTYSDSSYA